MRTSGGPHRRSLQRGATCPGAERRDHLRGGDATGERPRYKPVSASIRDDGDADPPDRRAGGSAGSRSRWPAGAVVVRQATPGGQGGTSGSCRTGRHQSGSPTSPPALFAPGTLAERPVRGSRSTARDSGWSRSRARPAAQRRRGRNADSRPATWRTVRQAAAFPGRADPATNTPSYDSL